MKSNITVRSNVFLRRTRDLLRDRDFQKQVRGGRALRKLKAKLGIPDSQFAGLLTPVQLAELRWDTPCSRCGCRPEGPITKNGFTVIEFRCPEGSCPSRSETINRTVLLDPALLDAAIQKSGLTDPGEAVTLAVTLPPVLDEMPADTRCRRVPLRVGAELSLIPDAQIRWALYRFVSQSV
jgi:hypothetical protein